MEKLYKFLALNLTFKKISFSRNFLKSPYTAAPSNQEGLFIVQAKVS